MKIPHAAGVAKKKRKENSKVFSKVYTKEQFNDPTISGKSNRPYTAVKIPNAH